MGGRRAGRPRDRRCVGDRRRHHRPEHQQQRQSVGRGRLLGWRRPRADRPSIDGAGSWSGFVSPYFGFQLVCGVNPCGQTHLASSRSRGPSTSRFARRSVHRWPRRTGCGRPRAGCAGSGRLNFSGSSPSGMCGLNGSINQIPITGTTSPRDVATWHQCSAPPVSDTINTAAYGAGPMPLYIAGYDAAGEIAQYTKTIDVDNSTPTLSLSGPTDAPSTAGTQYVTATAGGSPSGIDGIACSVDGSPANWYPNPDAARQRPGPGQRARRASGQLQRPQQCRRSERHPRRVPDADVVAEDRRADGNGRRVRQVRGAEVPRCQAAQDDPGSLGHPDSSWQEGQGQDPHAAQDRQGHQVPPEDQARPGRRAGAAETPREDRAPPRQDRVPQEDRAQARRGHAALEVQGHRARPPWSRDQRQRVAWPQRRHGSGRAAGADPDGA